MADWNTHLQSHIKFPAPGTKLWKRKAILCERCENVGPALLVQQQARNGAVQVYWLCWACQESIKKQGMFVAHEKLREHGVRIFDLPTVMPNGGGRVETCVRCGVDLNLENHHWAPKAKFEDADQWPQDDLCTTCHGRWHKTMEASK